jgi:hypothetical protein
VWGLRRAPQQWPAGDERSIAWVSGLSSKAFVPLGYAGLLDIGRAGPISLDAESSAPVLWPPSFTLTYIDRSRIRSLIPNS